MLGLIKPAQWAFTRALVDPRWGWFFRDLKIFHPTWGGAGAPRDVIGQNHGVVTSVPPVWKGGLTGLTLKYDDTVTQQNNWYTVNDGPDLTLPAGNWTIAWYLSIPDNSGSFFQYWHSWGAFKVDPSINVYVVEDDNAADAGKIKASIRDSAGNGLDPTSNVLAPWSGYKLVFLRKFAANEARFYIDGIQSHDRYDTEQANTGEVNLSSDLNIGRRSDNNSARFFGGELSWWAKWDRDIGEAAILQLTRDPFGPITMLDEVGVVVVPTAVGDPVIEIVPTYGKGQQRPMQEEAQPLGY